MTDMAYIISKTLEHKIAIAENNDQNTLFVTLDVLKEILALLKEQPEIVMCKDCRKNMMCETTIHKPKDWFCADGVK